MSRTTQAHILNGVKIRPVDGSFTLPPKASLRATWISQIVCECGHESLFLEAAETHWQEVHAPGPKRWWQFWKKRA